MKIKLLLFFAFLISLNTYSQTTYTFDGSSSNLWSDANNWSPSYPGATINTNDTVIINAEVDVDVLLYNFGLIHISQNVGRLTFLYSFTNEVTGILKNDGYLNVPFVIGFYNNGTFINNDNMELQDGSYLYNEHTGTIIQNGTITFYISVNPFTVINKGTWQGSSTTTAIPDFRNEGIFAPGNPIGSYTFNSNNLIFSPLSQLNIDIGGTMAATEYDQILAGIGTSVFLSGALNVTLQNGFTPQIGDSFDIIPSAIISGNFDTLNLPILPVGQEWLISNTGNNLTLSVIDITPTITIPEYNFYIPNIDQFVVENSTLTNANFSIVAPNGIASIQILDSVITEAQLISASTMPINITGTYGVLTIMSYNISTGLISYLYDPNGTNQNHSMTTNDVLEDPFLITLIDTNNLNATETLNIGIGDTSPTAAADTYTIADNAPFILTSGDVLINDTQSADTAFEVTGVAFGITPFPVGNVGPRFPGTYLDVEINADGTYGYTVQESTRLLLKEGDQVEEILSYTITDTDGDTSWTTLTITINGTDEQPLLVNNVTVSLDATGNASTTPNDIFAGDTANFPDANFSLDQDTFTCADLAMDTNKAIRFNGIDQHIAIADDASNDISGSYTMSCWVKYDATGPTLQRPISKPSALDGTGYCIAIDNNGSVGLTYIDGSSNAPNGLGTAAGTVPADTWTHIAVSYNDVNNMAYVYMNGVEVASGVINPVFVNSSQPLFIGTEGLGSVALTFRRFKGDIDEVRIWNVARTEAQIANDMNQRIAPQAGLVGLYRFNEGTGTIVNDASGAAPNGNFVNLDPATDWVDGAPAQSTFGETEVNLTISDSFGNSNSTTAIVTVQDNLSPVVVTQDVTINLICGAPESITADDINNGSSDNCSIASMTLDIDTFDDTTLGANTLTLNVIDEAGNSNSATATVTVVDNYPTRLYVDVNASGNNNGLDWSNAFTSLQSAIDQSVNCSSVNEIWVAEGTYYPSAYPRDLEGGPSLTERAYSFHLVDNVKMYGGFNGTEANLSERNIKLHPTILSGDIGVLGDATDNTYQVIVSVSDSNQTLVDGFIISDGYGDSFISVNLEFIFINMRLGGGILNYNSNTVYTNLQIINNAADFGGGIANVDSNTTFNNIILNNNNAVNNGTGGAVYSQNSNFFMTNVLFSGNTAQATPAIRLDLNSGITVTNATFFNNTSPSSTNVASAVFGNNTSSLIIQNSVFYNNTRDIALANGATVSGNNNFVELNPSLFGSPAGFTQSTSDPFTDSNETDGVDNILGTADDGLIPAQGSALIDAGVASPNTPLTDITGRTRIVGLVIDVGAYEFQQTLSNTDFNFSNYSIYPNPTNSILSIKGLKTSENVEVYNLSGQKLLTKTIDTNRNTINVSQLSAGIYFLKINNESIKFIKQ
ncbi:hypothetical protein BTO05_01620 [Winogradskyella sp. PC-19]|uniref:LamG-like jellyroll fold domain-containing protein n=1 Tax=unclassified Winogradskyella TaxID=2615021 RepID=UPI000B3CBAAF|nr:MULTISPECIES: LamG-like jellyroll fold domain-containing protein [unclassified Winogradskyella]ARV08403.1 hypothetical protein BTO05_01620 [Winogradskyella sp. PC-19]RZN80974.1 MAG: T9SS type A sorting domain-containing protein [Winogradskyella sp.]